MNVTNACGYSQTGTPGLKACCWKALNAALKGHSSTSPQSFANPANSINGSSAVHQTRSYQKAPTNADTTVF